MDLLNSGINFRTHSLLSKVSTILSYLYINHSVSSFQIIGIQTGFHYIRDITYPRYCKKETISIKLSKKIENTFKRFSFSLILYFRIRFMKHQMRYGEFKSLWVGEEREEFKNIKFNLSVQPVRNFSLDAMLAIVPLAENRLIHNG